MKRENWFKHDLDSRLVPSMQIFIKRTGWFGYGIFWAIVEEMHRGSRVEQLLTQLNRLSDALSVDFDKFMEVVNTAVELGLWEKNSESLYSPRVLKERSQEIEKIEYLTEMKRKAGLASAEKRKQNSTDGNRRSTESADVLDKNRREYTNKDNTVTLDTEKPKKLSTWPPPGVEVRSNVFLTELQSLDLSTHMPLAELDYWILELSNAAEQNVAAWKKKYKNHASVIMQWRKMKLEKGFIWNDQAAGYRYAPRNSTAQSEQPTVLRTGLAAIKILEERENAKNNPG